MGRDSDVLVGLDLGTKKITVIVAEILDESPEEAQIISIGQAPSRGIIKGRISDLEKATAAISEAVTDAEAALSDITITKAVVAFSCPEMLCCQVGGSISLGEGARQIVRDDIQKVISAALSKVKLPDKHIFIHTMPIKFAIDGNGGIDNPLDMTGTRLDVKLTALIVPISIPQNVVNCLQLAKIRVTGLLIKPIAESLGALTQDERDRGVSLLAIGGGTTSFTVFSEGKLMFAREVPIGGEHITNDIMQIMKIPYSLAERVKKDVSVKPEEHSSGTEVMETSGGRIEIDKAEAAEIADDRLSEIFTEIVLPTLEKMKEFDYNTDVILTGGVAQMPGIGELAAQCLKTDVSVAGPVLNGVIPGERSDSSYSASAGIIAYQMVRRRNPLAFINAPIEDFTSFAKAKKNEIEVMERPSETKRSKLKRAVKKMIKDLF